MLHEVLEAYIGAQESPGAKMPTFADVEKQTPSGKAYLNAHMKADLVDPRHKEVHLSGRPGGIYVTKFRDDDLIPIEYNPGVLINNLKRKKNEEE